MQGSERCEEYEPFGAACPSAWLREVPAAIERIAAHSAAVSECKKVMETAAAARLPLVSNDLEEVLIAMRAVSSSRAPAQDMLTVECVLGWFCRVLPTAANELHIRPSGKSSSDIADCMSALEGTAEEYAHYSRELPMLFISGPPQMREFTLAHPACQGFSRIAQAAHDSAWTSRRLWDQLLRGPSYAASELSALRHRDPAWARRYSGFLSKQVSRLDSARSAALSDAAYRPSRSTVSVRAQAAADEVLDACRAAAQGRSGLGILRSVHAGGADWLRGQPDSLYEPVPRRDGQAYLVCNGSGLSDDYRMSCPVCVLQGLARASRMVRGLSSSDASDDFFVTDEFISALRRSVGHLQSRVASSLLEHGPVLP